jgi:hypothetical protein
MKMSLSEQCQKTLKTHKRRCGAVAVVWVLGMAVFVLGPLLTPSAAGAMNCQLAKDVEEAATTRWIYLEGVREIVSSEVEKTTLTAEINALVDLRDTATAWIVLNCRSENDSP